MRTCWAILSALGEIGSDEAVALLNEVIDQPGAEPETMQAYLRTLAGESLMNAHGRDSAATCGTGFWPAASPPCGGSLFWPV